MSCCGMSRGNKINRNHQKVNQNYCHVFEVCHIHIVFFLQAKEKIIHLHNEFVCSLNNINFLNNTNHLTIILNIIFSTFFNSDLCIVLRVLFITFSLDSIYTSVIQIICMLLLPRAFYILSHICIYKLILLSCLVRELTKN